MRAYARVCGSLLRIGICVHVSSYYYYICVLILLYMCPHTSTMCPYVCVLILLYMCPHTTISVSSYYYICILILLYVSSYYYICVLILLYMCPQRPVLLTKPLCSETTMLLLTKPLCPHATIYVSSAPSSRRCARSSVRSGWAARRSRGRCASFLNASQHTSASE
jgi:hypothetical protein